MHVFYNPAWHAIKAQTFCILLGYFSEVQILKKFLDQGALILIKGFKNVVTGMPSQQL